MRFYVVNMNQFKKTKIIQRRGQYIVNYIINFELYILMSQLSAIIFNQNFKIQNQQKNLYFDNVFSFRRCNKIYRRGRNLQTKKDNKVSQYNFSDTSLDNEETARSNSKLSYKSVKYNFAKKNNLKLNGIRSNIKSVSDEQKCIENRLETEINEVKNIIAQRDYFDFELESQLQNIKDDLLQNKKHLNLLIKMMKQKQITNKIIEINKKQIQKLEYEPELVMISPKSPRNKHLFNQKPLKIKGIKDKI